MVSQPLGKYLNFLEAFIAFEGMGRPGGSGGSEKVLKNTFGKYSTKGIPRKGPQVPQGVPMGPKNFFETFSLNKLLGIYRQVWGLL